MILVEFSDGDLILNWDSISDEDLRFNFKLRDKVFTELKEKYNDAKINSDILFEMNKYAINRILQEKKNV